MIGQGTGGLDREQMRQVFCGIGRPVPARRQVLTGLASAARDVGLRPLLLLILLGLVVIMGLAGPAAGGVR